MTTLNFTAESALADGTDLTTGNSAFTDAFTTVSPGAGGSIKYSTAQKMHGARSIAFTPASGVACYVEWGGTSGSSQDAGDRAYIYFTGLPSVTVTIGHMRSTGGGTGLLDLTLSPTGQLAIISEASATTVFTTTGSIALNTWYRLEVTLSTPSASTAVVVLDTYLGDAESAVAALSSSATGQNFGTATIGTFRFGKTGAAGDIPTFYVDDAAVRTGSSALIGPAVANAAPTASAGADVTNAAVGTAVSVTGTDSDSDGTVAVREWTCTAYPSGSSTPTLTNAATATVTFTPAATGLYVLSYRVQDNAGVWSTSDTVNVYVPGTVVKAQAVTSNPGGWTVVGGSLPVVLADASTATYTQSNIASGNPSAQRIRLDPMSPPATFELDLGWRLSSAGAGTVTVTLFEGATSRKVWTPTVPGTSDTTATLTLTSGEIAAITSWLTLDVEIAWAQ